MSHPVWVRGLKLIVLVAIIELAKSHPVWVRGLKLVIDYDMIAQIHVAPRVGAWIETQGLLFASHYPWSHPVWVRGLKLVFVHKKRPKLCRTPCGCVD